MSRSELDTGSKLFSLGDLTGLFEGYLVLADDMVIAGVSPKFARSLGYTSDDLVGRSVDTICNQPTMSLLRSSLTGLASASQVDHKEIVMIDQHRRPITKLLSILKTCDDGLGYLVLLDEKSAALGVPVSKARGSESIENSQPDPDLRSLSTVEMKHILQVLSATGGNRTRASEILGISRVTLLAKIKRYELRSEA